MAASAVLSELMHPRPANWKQRRPSSSSCAPELANAQASIEREAQENSRLKLENQGLRAEGEKTVARMEEIEHRATDLRAELDHAHAEVERVRADLTEARMTAADEIAAANKRTDAASNELAKAHARTEAQAEQMSRAHAERDEARKIAVDAREAGAKLAGQLEATQAQNAALLAAMKEVGAVDKPAKGGKRALK